MLTYAQAWFLGGVDVLLVVGIIHFARKTHRLNNSFKASKSLEGQQRDPAQSLTDRD
jgi:hypothetical protein